MIVIVLLSVLSSCVVSLKYRFIVLVWMCSRMLLGVVIVMCWLVLNFWNGCSDVGCGLLNSVFYVLELKLYM